MEEKILQTKKNGMVMLLLTLLGGNCNRTDTVHAPLFRNPSFLSPKDRDRKEGTKSENRTSTSFI